MMKRTAIFVFVFVLMGGCGASIQGGLSAGATSLVDLSPILAASYARQNNFCRRSFPLAGQGERYQECIAPIDRARAARVVLDGALRAAQAALDATGERGLFGMIRCLFDASTELLRAASMLDRIPPALVEFVGFLGPYLNEGGMCNE